MHSIKPTYTPYPFLLYHCLVLSTFSFLPYLSSQTPSLSLVWHLGDRILFHMYFLSFHYMCSSSFCMHYPEHSVVAKTIRPLFDGQCRISNPILKALQVIQNIITNIPTYPRSSQPHPAFRPIFRQGDCHQRRARARPAFRSGRLAVMPITRRAAGHEREKSQASTRFEHRRRRGQLSYSECSVRVYSWEGKRDVLTYKAVCTRATYVASRGEARVQRVVGRNRLVLTRRR